MLYQWVKKYLLRIPHFLFLVLVAEISFLPDTGRVYESNVLLVALFLELVYLFVLIGFHAKEKELEIAGSCVAVLESVLLVYDVLTAKSGILNAKLFPAAGIVIHQLAVDQQQLLKGAVSSLQIIATGYLIALVLAIPLGLLLGYHWLLGRTASFVAGFLSSIPPVVFIPYGVALLPTFHAASVFVIVIAAFWPIFNGTMSGVMHVDANAVRAAQVMEVRGARRLFRVILPASLQEIFVGCNQGLGLSFILLTSAEMIGATQGLGYYIKTYSDFGDFKRVLLGILVVGFVVTGIKLLIKKLQIYLLRWEA